ncbi:hypothetical protein D3C73_1046320 [compost metagenome]
MRWFELPVLLMSKGRSYLYCVKPPAMATSTGNSFSVVDPINKGNNSTFAPKPIIDKLPKSLPSFILGMALKVTSMFLGRPSVACICNAGTTWKPTPRGRLKNLPVGIPLLV